MGIGTGNLLGAGELKPSYNKSVYDHGGAMICFAAYVLKLFGHGGQ